MTSPGGDSHQWDEDGVGGAPWWDDYRPPAPQHYIPPEQSYHPDGQDGAGLSAGSPVGADNPPFVTQHDLLGGFAAGGGGGSSLSGEDGGLDGGLPQLWLHEGDLAEVGGPSIAGPGVGEGGGEVLGATWDGVAVGQLPAPASSGGASLSGEDGGFWPPSQEAALSYGVQVSGDQLPAVPADPGPATALGQPEAPTRADWGRWGGDGGQPSEVGAGPSRSAATSGPFTGRDGLSSAQHATSFSEPVTSVEHSAGLGDAGVGSEPSHAGPIPIRAHSRYRVDPYPASGDAGAQGGHAPVGDFSRLDHPGFSAATHLMGGSGGGVLDAADPWLTGSGSGYQQPVLPDPPLLDPGRAGGFVPPSGPGDPAVSLNTYQYPHTSTDAGTGVLSARDQAILDTYDTARTQSGQRLYHSEVAQRVTAQGHKVSHATVSRVLKQHRRTGTGELSVRDQAILDTYDTARTDSGQRLTHREVAQRVTAEGHKVSHVTVSAVLKQHRRTGTGELSARDQAILDTYDTALTQSGERLTHSEVAQRVTAQGHKVGHATVSYVLKQHRRTGTGELSARDQAILDTYDTALTQSGERLTHSEVAQRVTDQGHKVGRVTVSAVLKQPGRTGTGVGSGVSGLGGGSGAQVVYDPAVIGSAVERLGALSSAGRANVAAAQQAVASVSSNWTGAGADAFTGSAHQLIGALRSDLANVNQLAGHLRTTGQAMTDTDTTFAQAFTNL